MALITLNDLPGSSARQVVDSLLSDTFDTLPIDGIARPALQSGCELSIYDSLESDGVITQQLRDHYAKCAIAINTSSEYSALANNMATGVEVNIRTLPTSDDADNVLWSNWTEGELKDYHYVISANPNGNTDYWKPGFNAHADVFNPCRELVTGVLKQLAMEIVGPLIVATGSKTQFNAAVSSNTSSGSGAENVELPCEFKTIEGATHRTSPAVANGTVDWLQVLADLESVTDGTQHMFTMYETVNTIQQTVNDFGAWRTAGGHGAYAIRFGLDHLMTESATMTQYQYSGEKTILGVSQTIDMINNVTSVIGDMLTNNMKNRLRFIKSNGL